MSSFPVTKRKGWRPFFHSVNWFPEGTRQLGRMVPQRLFGLQAVAEAKKSGLMTVTCRDKRWERLVKGR